MDKVNTVRIRCYRECRYNTHNLLCGYCTKDEISLTNEGCMDQINLVIAENKKDASAESWNTHKQQANPAICRICNVSCTHWQSGNKCGLLSPAECHNKIQNKPPFPWIRCLSIDKNNINKKEGNYE